MNANTGAQILLEGAQELLGAENFQRVAAALPSRGGKSRARSARVPKPSGFALIQPQEVGDFLHSLEKIYGRPGSQGMALRIGRASFRYCLDQVGDLLGLRALEYRLLPTPRRIKLGLEILARAIACASGCQVELQDTDNAWHWQMQGGPFNAGQQGMEPLCYVVAGLLQEFMAWAGGGRFYRVSALAFAESSPGGCAFQLEKRPLD